MSNFYKFKECRGQSDLENECNEMHKIGYKFISVEDCSRGLDGITYYLARFELRKESTISDDYA